jgi:glucose-1-phosphate adenylyltransferase
MTQFNSTSLNRHLARTYNVGSGVRFGGDGFVEVLAATQTPTDKEWFQGTADAVRQYAWLFSDTKVRPRGMGGERDAHGENAAAGGEA